MSNSMRSAGYKNVGTKIVIFVAIFSILVIGGVAIALKVGEPSPVINRDEMLWIRFETNDTCNGNIYVINNNNTITEQYLLYNTSAWQTGYKNYTVGTDLTIILNLWYIHDVMQPITYKVGRSPSIVYYDSITIIVVSDWEVPNF